MQDVYLVTASRAVFVNPNFSCQRIQRDALNISMPVSVDFWTCLPTARKWIVRRNAAVVVETDDFSEIVVKRLRLIGIKAPVA